ncbi:polysaccharide pyruvyl transferase family protein [Mesorhizobium sp.]|uniref:polysaccharide pyruvyl transferase family protein n=1 Tax=Mesorhizobium sp. TaxID=1871066 RepID=UPI000FE6BCA4|nr:polysaccharide pyruvyl transferase family protein [Mesorhizobium sp.]RWP38399.1 MAG: polysaccharide pyruvyl transferase family protein [Mesorhizobium sp.]
MSLFRNILLKSKQTYRKHVARNSVDLGLFYARGRDNIGDSMVPWLMREILGHDVPYSNPREANGRHLFTIGSILQYADQNSIVWGSGFVADRSRPHGIPKVLAVRGPLSAARLQQLGGKLAKVYGDPALLLPRYLAMPTIKQEFRIGLVPHYADAHKLAKTKVFKEDGVAICDVRTSNVREFVGSILRCGTIVSSSLHGIIIAEAFGVPAVWAKFDDDVAGSGFKFADYYGSTGRSVEPMSFYSLDSDVLGRQRPREPKALDQMSGHLLEVLHGELS